MKIDTPLTFGLTVGQDRRIPQDGDAQVEVPPMVLPVALMIHPTSFVVGGGIVQGSSIVDIFLTLTNGVAVQSNMFILAPGLWELELTLASVFNYNAPLGQADGAEITMEYQNSGNIQILERIAAIGSFTDYNRLRVLLTSNAVIALLLDGNGVGQTVTARGTVNAIRIL